MSSNKNNNSAPIKKKDGVFLLIADKSDEFLCALRYAARLAEYSHAHIGMAYIIEDQGFQHWGNIEDRMRKEQRQEAEQYLFDLANDVNSFTGEKPCFYLLNGTSREEAIINLINEDKAIKMLVLGGNTQGSPGPLVSYFSGKGLGNLRVPLSVVPGHLDNPHIDSIF